MILPQDVGALKETVNTAKTAFVLLGANPTYDHVASALALYLSLKAAGKDTQIVSSADMRVEFSHLVGVNEIVKKMGNRNLQVSFQYEENSVDKVSYTISEDGKTFNLIIAPKSGFKPLDPSRLAYSYTGAEAEVVFTVGVGGFDDLGEMYTAERSLFSTAFTVSLTNYPIQPFAHQTLDTSNQSSLAEGVAVLLRELGYQPKDDVATNLLSAIEQATQRLQSFATTADTLEIAAGLLRGGARRSAATNPALSTTPATTPAFAQVLRTRASIGQHAAPVMPVVPAVPQTPPASQTLPQQQIFQLQHVEQPGAPAQAPQSPTPPAEWTQPKIFTGTTKV